ncbi:hypothetical protein J4466_01495 [Candidatus Pacearchaeota archaeon]|nr:hypothetical protein [Candidatus Pacearchaeota archaeon]
MSKKKVNVLIISIIMFFGIFIIPFASADIFLATQPESVYNIGDNLNVELGSDGGEGWASVELVCGEGGNSKMLYFHYVDDTSTASISAPLTKEFLGSMKGQCYLSLSFNGVKKQSFIFTISDKIDVSVMFNGNSFEPGENLLFNGEVKRANGGDVDGSVELKFSGIELSAVVPIVNNKFSGNMTIPNNVAAKTYDVIVFASEKNDKNEVTNFGQAADSIEIKQKPTKIDLTAPENVNPGKDIEFKAVLFDQTGLNIEGRSVAFKISDVSGKEILARMSNVGEINYYTFEKNAPFGYWKINAEAEVVTAEKEFYVEKNMEATFHLVNGTLVVRSLGNVPYNKTVEIRIGNETKVSHLELNPGESVEFELTAPNGDYDVIIKDDAGTEASWSKVPLTGEVISLDGSGKRKLGGFFSRTWIAWIFLVAVFGSFLLLSSKKVINKNIFSGFGSGGMGNVGKTNPPKTGFVAPIIGDKKDEKGGVVRVVPGRDEKSLPVIEHDTGIAVHTPVLDGNKQFSSLVAVKIKNYNEVKDNNQFVNETLKSITSEINNSKGKVYRADDFIVGIFAPISTKTFENEVTAVRVAKAVSAKLKFHNDKFSQKINFGVGVNSGDIIAKKQEGKLLFTPIGATLSGARRVADLANNDVLLSEDTNKKVMSKVKTNLNAATSTSGIKTYSINQIVDRDNNNKFIEGFLQRNQEYKSLREYKFGK